MKSFTTLILLISLTFGTNAQDVKIDSLKKVLAKYSSAKNSFSTDTLRINTLLALGKSQAHPDSSIVWYDRALTESKRVGWDRGEAMGYLGLADKNNVKGLHYKSIQYSYTALNIAEKNFYKDLQGWSFYYLGNAYYTLNEFDKAALLFNKAKAQISSKDNKREYLFCYIDIGLCYFYTKNYPKAISYFNVAIKLNRYYPQLKEVDFFAKFNTASAYREMGNKHQAILLFEEASLFTHPNPNENVSLLSELSLLYISQKEYQKALAIAQKARKLITNDNYGAKKNIYEVFYLAYKGLGNQRQALEYFETLIQEKSKEDDMEQARKIEALKFEYDNQKKQDNIELLNKDLNYQKIIRNTAWTGIIILLISGFLLFLSNRKLQEKNKKIETQKNEIIDFKISLEDANDKLQNVNNSLEGKVKLRTQELVQLNNELILKNKEITEALYKGQNIERKRIASELHDNLGGTLSAIKWKLEAFEEDQLSVGEKYIYENILSMLKVAYADLRLISHNLLPEELDKNGIRKALERLINEINEAKKIRINLDFDIDEKLLTKKIKLELYSMCLELINNVLKHSKAKNLTICFDIKEEKLTLNVIDDGTGINRANGMGLTNLQNRIQSLNGLLSISQNVPQGTIIMITIPVSQEVISFSE